MIKLIYQRLKNDCGVAALSMLLDLSYEDSAKYLLQFAGKSPGPTTYNDLISVIDGLKLNHHRCWWSKSNKRRIVRCRESKGDKHSHWIVISESGIIYCPWVGVIEKKDDYFMCNFSQCIYLDD